MCKASNQFIHHSRTLADLQGVPEGVRQRVPAAAAHDLARRVRRPEEIQVRRLRKGFQVQAPPQGMEFKAMPRTKFSQKKRVGPGLSCGK